MSRGEEPEVDWPNVAKAMAELARLRFRHTRTESRVWLAIVL